MKSIWTLLVSLCVAISITGYTHAAQTEVRGEPLTQGEIISLPPVCKLILIDKPLSHLEYVGGEQQNAALFDRPEYRMAKNAIHLHHWCWATVSRERYFRASSSQAKFAYKEMFHDDIDYVIRNMRPDWEYMPFMHAEKGDMYWWDKNYVGAISEAQKALDQAPDFAKAYILQARTYRALNQKDKALAAATEGLKRNPTSRALKRLYDQVGGKHPYPEPYSTPQEQESAAPSPQAESLSGAAAAGTEQSKQPESQVAPPTAPSENTPKPNPYCRFCP